MSGPSFPVQNAYFASQGAPEIERFTFDGSHRPIVTIHGIEYAIEATEEGKKSVKTPMTTEAWVAEAINIAIMLRVANINLAADNLDGAQIDSKGVSLGLRTVMVHDDASRSLYQQMTALTRNLYQQMTGTLPPTPSSFSSSSPPPISSLPPSSSGLLAPPTPPRSAPATRTTTPPSIPSTSAPPPPSSGPQLPRVTIDPRAAWVVSGVDPTLAQEVKNELEGRMAEVRRQHNPGADVTVYVNNLPSSDSITRLLDDMVLASNMTISNDSRAMLLALMNSRVEVEAVDTIQNHVTSLIDEQILEDGTRTEDDIRDAILTGGGGIAALFPRDEAAPSRFTNARVRARVNLNILGEGALRALIRGRMTGYIEAEREVQSYWFGFRRNSRRAEIYAARGLTPP